MRIVKWVKLEMARSRGLLKFLLCFLAISVFVALWKKDDIPAGWLSLYMIFGSLVVASTPFSMQPAFVEMLPTKIYERVFGRFLFGAGLITAAALGGLGVQTATAGFDGGAAWSAFILTCLFTGIAYMVMAVEFLLFYCFTIRNAQIMSLIRTIPGFIFFFGISGLMEGLQSGEEPPALLLWAFDHTAVLGVLALLAGILAVVLCAVAASVHERCRLV